MKCQWTVLVDKDSLLGWVSHTLLQKTFEPLCDLSISFNSGSNVATLTFYNFWFYDRAAVYEWMTSSAVKELRKLGIDVILAQEDKNP